jgi:hypothetical protein
VPGRKAPADRIQPDVTSKPRKKDNDTITMKFLLHKDKEEKNPAHKSKSVAALPCNRPFTATHMLFLPTHHYNETFFI